MPGGDESRGPDLSAPLQLKEWRAFTFPTLSARRSAPTAISPAVYSRANSRRAIAGARGGDRRARVGVDAGDGVPGRRHSEQTRCGGAARDSGAHPGASVGGGDDRGRARRNHGRHWRARGWSAGSIACRWGCNPSSSASCGAPGVRTVRRQWRRRLRYFAMPGSQCQHRSDCGAFGADGGVMAGVARLGGAPRAGARFGLHAGGG